MDVKLPKEFTDKILSLGITGDLLVDLRETELNELGLRTTFQIHKFHHEVERYSAWLKNKSLSGKDSSKKSVEELNMDDPSRRLRFRVVGDQKENDEQGNKGKPRFVCGSHTYFAHTFTYFAHTLLTQDNISFLHTHKHTHTHNTHRYESGP